jgi:homocysteine S-methyltransferase
MDFLDELQSRIVVADGPMGTVLLAQGVPLERCFEELCVSDPDRVRGIHEQYLAAGARLIRTDSFGANSVRLAAHGFQHRVSEINWSAAQLARDAAKAHGARVAASIGPLGLSGAQAQERGIDRAEVFSEQMGALLDGGVRIVLLETFTDLEELLIALEVKHSLHHCPVICSLSCDAEGLLRDGIAVGEAWMRLIDAGADLVGVNCIAGEEMIALLAKEPGVQAPISAFPSAGLPRRKAEGRFTSWSRHSLSRRRCASGRREPG